MISKGFTLPEILISVALVALIAGMGVPVYQSFQNRNDIAVVTDEIVQTFRQAQIRAQAVDGDTAWGVFLDTGTVVLFGGDDYASRDVSLDEVRLFPSSITPSGVVEVVFAKVTGVPDTTGTTTLTHIGNEIRTITINEKGSINF